MNVVKRVLAGCLQPHTCPAFMDSLLKISIWSISSRVLARTKIILLADLDSFFKSLEPFQRLKKDIWRRWGCGRNMVRRHSFLFFFSLSKPLGTNLRILGFAHPKRRRLSSFSHAMKCHAPTLHREEPFQMSITHAQREKVLLFGRLSG